MSYTSVEEVAGYIFLYSRFHPEATASELNEMTLSMISTLPDPEKAKFVEEYSEYCNQHQQQPQQDPYDIPDYYVELYNSTNEAP